MTSFKLILLTSFFFIFFSSCNERVDVRKKEIVEKPEDINARAEDLIRGTLKEIMENKSLQDSFKLKNPEVLQSLYDQNSFQLLWTDKGVFKKTADSLLAFIDSSMAYGLFPEDYHAKKIASLKLQLLGDTSKEKKLDASQWAYTDMLLTSAFVQTVKDLKTGRLLPDSVMAKDSSLTTAFFQDQLNSYKVISNDSFAKRLEPHHSDYIKLKQALKVFLRSAQFKTFTLITSKDSSQLPALVYKRLQEEDSIILTSKVSPDSTEIAQAIKKYQKRKNLKEDGRISSTLISKLNDTDKEKFIRVAITLDRYKQLQTLPIQYIWVNLPSFFLQVRDSDAVVLKSRVVVGKPLTRTPIITSAISDMITYPKWTIPESIIKKEILPGLKRDPGYTKRKGFSLVDKDGNEVDPYSVNWSKFQNSIPYKVVQGSGDDNALGILKFNFPNKFSVYLHDTNQRYLFSKNSRALSHGCVRVQAWDELAKYILKNDSSYSVNAVPVDSLKRWLDTKQKKYIPVRKPIPLFIRYFTCDAAEGHLVFYEDIYGEDKKFRDKIFANK